MPSVEQVLQELKGEMVAAERALEEARGRPGTQLLDQLIVRYLWGATGAAGALHAAARAEHPGGTGPLLRYLVEVLIDLTYLFRGYGDVGPDASDEDQELAQHEGAARILVWDILQWEKEWGLHEEVAGVDPSIDDDRRPRETAAQAIERMAASFEQFGEDPSVIRSVFEANRDRRLFWHWSEKGIRKRLEAIGRRVEGTDEEEQWAPVLAMFRALYPAVSDEAHPPPGPKLIEFDHRANGTIRAPDTAQSDPDTVRRCVGQARDLLQMIRGIVTKALE